MEHWKEVVGYEGVYEVSDKGRVRSVDRVDRIGRKRRGQEIKPATQKNGYKFISINHDGKQKHALVHRLVAEAFLENADGLPEVNHKNENKADNSVENLEWCTHKQNHNYGTGHKKSAEKQSVSVVQKNVDGEIVARWRSIREAARTTGAGRKEIGRCCNGKLRTSNGYIWEYADDRQSRTAIQD